LIFIHRVEEKRQIIVDEMYCLRYQPLLLGNESERLRFCRIIKLILSGSSALGCTVEANH
jgi:hypothetical protein